ncbi:MAG TPA: hypothetical protein VF503_00165 [Sphingobium sp.]|uniref:hypothetical protein n=1 Tax=Sphingobium sp. TaxID=1912891 RepID=UPI002ED6BD5A
MDDPKNISAHYVKSPTFNEHPLHGVYGGVTTAGLISMAVFSERMPIPTKIEMELTPVDGVPGAFQAAAERLEGKDGIVRFVHGVYYLDVEMAKSVMAWLADKVKSFEDLKNVG